MHCFNAPADSLLTPCAPPTKSDVVSLFVLPTVCACKESEDGRRQCSAPLALHHVLTTKMPWLIAQKTQGSVEL